MEKLMELDCVKKCVETLGMEQESEFGSLAYSPLTLQLRGSMISAAPQMIRCFGPADLQLFQNLLRCTNH